MDDLKLLRAAPCERRANLRLPENSGKSIAIAAMRLEPAVPPGSFCPALTIPQT
jgi:hypothetical protein